MKPSKKMASIGIAQKGDPILTQPAKPFDLQMEIDDAQQVISQLHAAIERAANIHHFAKGMGVAAPQIGIGRAAVVIRSADGEQIILLNPRIIKESTEFDEQFEGCWSFFDVRGKVHRPLAIHIEHQDLTGAQRFTIFKQGLARLVAHEIDHLNGVLYTDRMRPDVKPISLDEYRGAGKTWTYFNEG